MGKRYVVATDKIEDLSLLNDINYSLIIHDWNPYLVPREYLSSRPKYSEYENITSSDDLHKTLGLADNAWFNKIKYRLYVSEALQQQLKEGIKINQKTEFFINRNFNVEYGFCEYKDGKKIPFNIAVPVADFKKNERNE